MAEPMRHERGVVIPVQLLFGRRSALREVLQKIREGFRIQDRGQGARNFCLRELPAHRRLKPTQRL